MLRGVRALGGREEQPIYLETRDIKSHNERHYKGSGSWQWQNRTQHLSITPSSAWQIPRIGIIRPLPDNPSSPQQVITPRYSHHHIISWKSLIQGWDLVPTHAHRAAAQKTSKALMFARSEDDWLQSSVSFHPGRHPSYPKHLEIAFKTPATMVLFHSGSDSGRDRSKTVRERLIIPCCPPWTDSCCSWYSQGTFQFIRCLSGAPTKQGEEDAPQLIIAKTATGLMLDTRTAHEVYFTQSSVYRV